MISQTLESRRSSRPAALFLVSAAWIVLSLAASREVSRLASPLWQDLVREGLATLLLFGGFYTLARAFLHDLRPLSSIGVVRRPSSLREFGVGAALGWGIALALLIPAVVTGNLSLTFSFAAITLLRTFVSALTLAAFALTVQLILAGLPVRLLVRAAGPGMMMTAVLFVVLLLAVTGAQGEGRGVLVSMLAASLFCAAFLRTRAIWVALGIQIGWTLTLQLLFGASSPFTPISSGIVQAGIGGVRAVTGGAFGPEASLFAVLVLVAALIVLFRVTRDYAWHYTYDPIVGAGREMDVAPPAEHLREEKRAAASAPLVQIGGIAPAPKSAPEHPF